MIEQRSLLSRGRFDIVKGELGESHWKGWDEYERPEADL